MKVPTDYLPTGDPWTRMSPATIRPSMLYTTYGDGLTHLAAFAKTLHPRPKRPRRGRPQTDSR